MTTTPRSAGLLAATLLAACSRAASPTAAPAHERGDSPAPSGTASPSAPPASAIEARQIDSVWVFVAPAPRQGEERSALAALHGGNASIVDGCLLIGDLVVVWQAEQLDDARAAVAAGKAGSARHFQLGGGGFSLDEGTTADEFPAAVRAKCPAAGGLWLQSPT